MGRVRGREGTPDTSPLTSRLEALQAPPELEPCPHLILPSPRSVVAPTDLGRLDSMVMPVEQLEAWRPSRVKQVSSQGAGLRLLSLKWGWGRWGVVLPGRGAEMPGLFQLCPSGSLVPNLLSLSKPCLASCLETNPTRHTTCYYSHHPCLVSQSPRAQRGHTPGDSGRENGHSIPVPT